MRSLNENGRTGEKARDAIEKFPNRLIKSLDRPIVQIGNSQKLPKDFPVPTLIWDVIAGAGTFATLMLRRSSATLTVTAKNLKFNLANRNPDRIYQPGFCFVSGAPLPLVR